MFDNKQSKKRHNQSLVRRASNKANKSEIKTLTKKVIKVVESADLTLAQEQFKLLQKKVDTEARKGVITKNKANRIKSATNKKIKALLK